LNQIIPDSTAVRVALWRALHVQIDSPPHILVDEIGLKLVNPDEGWQQRPDMHPQGTKTFRASIVARARFVEDLVENEVNHNRLDQYVILGAGLDTFAQRRPEAASKLQVFEVEKSDTLKWKKQRLLDLGYSIPPWLHFVSVNFESHLAWWKQLMESGFDIKKPAFVTSMGVSMYLTKSAIIEMLQLMITLAPGSKFIMTFMLPLDLVDSEDRIGYERAIKGAQASGTPFLSFFTPEEMIKLAMDVGFKSVEHQSTSAMTPRYFSNRTDGLKPSTGEELLILSI